MNTTRRSCKYWTVCGSNANCAACRGGYEPKEKKGKGATR